MNRDVSRFETTRQMCSRTTGSQKQGYDVGVAENWPSWHSRWYGYVLRVVVGAISFLASLVLVAVSSAIGGSERPASLDELTFQFVGWFLMGATLTAAIKPTKVTIVVYALVILLLAAFFISG